MNSGPSTDFGELEPRPPSFAVMSCFHCTETQELLEGNFKPDHQPQLRTIRLYVSSEFTGYGLKKANIARFNFFFFADSTHERAHIASSVFPSLHSHCCSLGLQFCGVDLFSVLPSSFRSLLPPCPGNSPAPSDEEWPREKGLIHLLEREGIFLLASEEIKRCQALSAGPNFIVSTTADPWSLCANYQDDTPPPLPADAVGTEIWVQATPESDPPGRL